MEPNGPNTIEPKQLCYISKVNSFTLLDREKVSCLCFLDPFAYINARDRDIWLARLSCWLHLTIERCRLLCANFRSLHMALYKSLSVLMWLSLCLLCDCPRLRFRPLWSIIVRVIKCMYVYVCVGRTGSLDGWRTLTNEMKQSIGLHE